MNKKIIIGITGASGAIYAHQLIHDILLHKEYSIAVIYSANGKKVWNYELELPPFESSEQLIVYDNEDMFSPPASGSSNFDAMVVIPCSMGTLAKISNGISSNLICRAADVMLKEQKPLIIVPRELPYNLIHLNNMTKIIQTGGIVLPASPSFYNHPNNINELVKTVTDRILKYLNVPVNIKEWGK